MNRPSARIVYVASTFPKLTETFILREVGEMKRRGMAVSVFTIRPRPTGTLHADALPYLETTHYAPWFGLRHLAAFFSLCARKPRGAARGIAFLALDSLSHWRYPLAVLKTLVCTGKMFLFTQEMEREGVRHVHGHFANIPTTAAVFSARVLDITYSFTGHAWDIFVPCNQAGLARKIHGAEFVATCTGFNAKLLSRLARAEDRSRIVLNHHGLDLAGYVPVESREVHRIVAGGRLTEQKGLRYLIDAALRLRERGLDFQIEIVGDGPLARSLAQQINDLHLTRTVELVGSMPHEQLMARMRTAGMVVLPCIETAGGFMDGIPNLLVESLALEVPVVSSRLSGIPELVEDGVNGLLTAPGDASALADAMESLLRDPVRARAMGRAGRARVEQMFDLQRNASELVARFEEIMQRARG